jgi:ubiquinone biosynthesis protein
MRVPYGWRNLARAREIFRILFLKYGFGYVADQLGLARLLPPGLRRRRERREAEELNLAERLRLALGELGPTFIKLAQVLSTRADLLPQSFLSELRKLQDEAPPAPYAAIEPILVEELGSAPSELFASFDTTPLASASIGQVYAATLPDGRPVTVKVQRPGVERVIEADLNFLGDVAAAVHDRVPALRHYNFPGLAREFRAILQEELLYTLEGHNADRLRENLARHPDGELIQVPGVIWELTTRRVLTMERGAGVRVERAAELRPAVDRRGLAAALGRSLLRQVFLDGFFHGDPHQGNVLISPEGRLLLLDFGTVGRLDRRLRRLLTELVISLFDEDMDGVTHLLCQIGAVGEETDLGELRRDLGRLIGRYYFLPRRELRLGELLARMLGVVFHHRITLPPELSLLSKAFIAAEGVGLQLDPEFDFNELARGVAEELKRERLKPSALAEEILRRAKELRRQLALLPERLDRALTNLERGSFRVRIDDPGAERRLREETISRNRITLAIVTAALFVSSAVLVVASKHPLPLWLGIASAAAGAALGLALLLAVVRSGRL